MVKYYACFDRFLLYLKRIVYTYIRIKNGKISTIKSEVKNGTIVEIYGSIRLEDRSIWHTDMILKSLKRQSEISFTQTRRNLNANESLRPNLSLSTVRLH